MDSLARLPHALRLSAAAAALVMASGSCGAETCKDGTCPDAGNANLPAQGTPDPRPYVVDEEQACIAQSVHAMRGPPSPVDVIFVIDNSGSMDEEIAAVRDNINRDFAAIITASGVDYRVIVISRYGVEPLSICVEPPLAKAACSAGLRETNSAVFYHYDQEIGSNDALCQILTTFDRPDPIGRAPEGWQAWLRPNAHKAFVTITDDDALCTYGQGESRVDFGTVGADPFQDALRFHQTLLARSGTQFGVPPDIKYQFFSIVGLASGSAPGEPLFPHQNVVDSTCDTAPGAGSTYQALSIITDALRYPVCEGRSFDAVFRVLARSVIQASQADCEFELPQAPPDQSLLLPSVNLQYQPGDGSAPQHFTQVASPDACTMQRAFYIGERIQLCPAACSLVKKDPNPSVQILFGCLVTPQ